MADLSGSGGSLAGHAIGLRGELGRDRVKPLSVILANNACNLMGRHAAIVHELVRSGC